MVILALNSISTDSHYKKSIAQTAAQVKSFPILMGANFLESKKGLWWGLVLGRFLLGSGNEIYFFLTKLNNYWQNFACFYREILR
ncbi:unknown protein [Microcystis aeruginosa NIES-843]|uniref:Uncharacterized protein n=1 Tax=Microcystis aeruginosa (strain NIES-843 / IAM M-2473) TaxID=449447 RepID=B0JHF9_MICAN|nr:unknown protein [Microcystis aeruginosa NIES-843]